MNGLVLWRVSTTNMLSPPSLCMIFRVPPPLRPSRRCLFFSLILLPSQFFGLLIWSLSILHYIALVDSLTQWRDDVNSKVVLANEEPIPIILLANKVLFLLRPPSPLSKMISVCYILVHFLSRILSLPQYLNSVIWKKSQSTGRCSMSFVNRMVFLLGSLHPLRATLESVATTPLLLLSALFKYVSISRRRDEVFGEEDTWGRWCQPAASAPW